MGGIATNKIFKKFVQEHILPSDLKIQDFDS